MKNLGLAVIVSLSLICGSCATLKPKDIILDSGWIGFTNPYYKCNTRVLDSEIYFKTRADSSRTYTEEDIRDMPSIR